MGAGEDVEGGLATVYSFVDLAILRVGLAPVPSEQLQLLRIVIVARSKTAGSDLAVKPSRFARWTVGGGCPHMSIAKSLHKHLQAGPPRNIRRGRASIMSALFEREKEIPANAISVPAGFADFPAVFRCFRGGAAV